MNCPICQSQLIIDKQVNCVNFCLFINSIEYTIVVYPYIVNILTRYKTISYIDRVSPKGYENLIEFNFIIPLDISKDLLSQVQNYLIIS